MSIHIADLSWSVPEGVVKSIVLKLIAGELPVQTGSIAVSVTLGVLRQTVHGRPAKTLASLFGVTDGLATLYRAEAGEATADDFANTNWLLDAHLDETLAHASLYATADTQLTALSLENAGSTLYLTANGK